MDTRGVRERILRRDGALLIMDKPPGLPTSGRSLDDSDCLQYGLIQSFGQMVWAVHQLDADTSGINLFVLEKKAVAEWKRKMESPDAEKIYLAVVKGKVTWSERTVDAAIGKVDERSLGVCEEGKAARSHFRVLHAGERSTLLAVKIETGRTHQIRIHASYLGHPLLGEEWYTSAPCERHPRQALHCFAMNLGEWNAVIPPAVDFRELMRREKLPWNTSWESAKVAGDWWRKLHLDEGS